MTNSINELKSYTEYNVSTPTSVFTIGFQYEHNVDHVNVYVDGVEATAAGYTIQHDSQGTVQLTPTVPSGVVRLVRETDIDTSAHTFSAGAKFTAVNMDENFKQIRHSQQEVRDAFDFLEYNTLGVVEAAKSATGLANTAAQTANDAAAQVDNKIAELQPAIDSKLREFDNAINTIVVNDGVPASVVLDTSGKTQQDINNAFIGVNTIADLLAIGSPFNGMRVNVKSYHADINKGGGTFVWAATSTATANNGTVFAVSGVATGRWIRQLADSEFITPQMFGAKADGVTDDYDAIVAAINSLDPLKISDHPRLVKMSPTVFFPRGVYYLRDTLEINMPVSLKGENVGQAGSPALTLVFPKGKDGIIVQRHNTVGTTGTKTSSGVAAGDVTRIEGIAFEQRGYTQKYARILDYNPQTSHIMAISPSAKFAVGDSLSEFERLDRTPLFTATVSSVDTSTHMIVCSSLGTTFSIGEVITGQTSGATGTLVYIGKAQMGLLIKGTAGTFQADERIVGQTSGATGTVSSFDSMGRTIYGFSAITGSITDPETGDHVLIGSNEYGSAIILRARAEVKSVSIRTFPWHGIVVNGSNSGNANCFTIKESYIANVGLNGVYTFGPDANAGSITSMDIMVAGKYGVYEDSFLGNHYFSCHSSYNGTGGYYSRDKLNFSAFLGCYSEGGQVSKPFPDYRSKFGGDTTITGGDHGAGIHNSGAVKPSFMGMSALTTPVSEFSTTNRAVYGSANYELSIVGYGSATMGQGTFVSFYPPTTNHLDKTKQHLGGKIGITRKGYNSSQFEIYTQPVITDSTILLPSGGNPTKGATLKPIITDGVITGCEILDAGEGYQSAPTITAQGSWAGLNATTEIYDGKIVKVNVTASPSGLKSLAPVMSMIVRANGVTGAIDNTSSLGTAAIRWSQVYAGTGTINTSDGREKQQIRDLSEAEKRVAVKLKSQIKAFKFNDAVSKKGDKARIHFGVIAQEVKAAFESEGLVAADYAILCYDEWEAEYREITEEITVTNDAGEEVTEIVKTGERELIREAGNRYGVRYEELLAFIISTL